MTTLSKEIEQRPVYVYTCQEQEVKSFIVSGNAIICLNIKYNLMRKWMYKLFFGLDLRNMKGGFPHV